MMDGKEKPQEKTPGPTLPRGELRDHMVPTDHRVVRKDVELAGALWDIEFDYLTLAQYTSHTSNGIDAGSVLSLRMALSKSMNPSLNGKPVDWDVISPVLGLELAKYLDLQLNLPPTKNY